VSNEILHRYVNEFRLGRDLLAVDAEPFLDALLAETDEGLISDVLCEWESKYVADDELFLLASILRNRMTRISTHHELFVDAVGTGGSKTKTFNISTAAAFVIAGAGVPVAKHGNRAATSNSGSADVLAALGIKADIEPSQAENCLNKLGICFMFAPRFHSLSPVLAKVRRSLGRPTIFNNLGPLSNPAGAQHQIIGVWHHDLIGRTANVLARLGTTKSWIVHGENGLDEISLKGKTRVAEIVGLQVRKFEVSAADFGVNNLDGELPAGLGPVESAGLIRKILENRQAEEPAEEIVAINAAAAIYVAGAAADLKTAYQKALVSIRSGAAAAKMESLVSETNR